MTRARDVADTQENLGGGVPPFVAGKNAVINGDFGVWQRGTSFSNPTNNVYTADRWAHGFNNANPTSSTTSREAFTLGTAPVAGYEGTYFGRSTITTVGSTTIFRPFTQRIEDVRTLANQTITISFWAKADSARSLTVNFQQNFGSGGSSPSGGAGLTVSLSTSWQRFTWSAVLIPSISGKTIGTNSYLEFLFQQAAASGSVLDLWGVQVEAGSVATPFTTATGTVQGELAACQRYFNRFNGGASLYYANGMSDSTTTAYGVYLYPVTMRAVPTFAANGAASSYAIYSSGGAITCSAVPGFTNAGVASAVIINTAASGLTAGRAVMLAAGASTSLDFSSEL
jgi:hypothetical protein